jgi:hypothetical protein
MIIQRNFFVLSSAGDDNTKISLYYSLSEDSERFLKYAGEIMFADNSNIIICMHLLVYLIKYFLLTTNPVFFLLFLHINARLKQF